MGKKGKEYILSINPDADILTNMMNIIGNFAVQGICARFSPFDAAEELIMTGKFDVSRMLSFEDITWDTVFAKMKTVEFVNGASEDQSGINDMSFYMDYADMIHDIDSDALIKEFGEESVEVSGYICLELWQEFVEKLLPELLEVGNDYNAILVKLKDNVGPFINEAVKKYITEGIDGELGELVSTTNDAFTKMGADETGFYKMMYASIVKGSEVAICNPEYLQLGDRLKSAIKYYNSAASVAIAQKLAGELKSEKFEVISKYAPGFIEYIPTMISLVVSCAIVITLDKNPMLIQLVEEFNEIPTITGNIALYRESAARFEKLAAKLAKIDIEDMKKQIAFYDDLSKNISSISDPKKLNDYLLNYYKTTGKQLPWGNRSLEEHWEDKNSRLVFK